MELTTYLEGLRRDLTAVAAPGGPEVSRAAELLTGSLEAATRLTLLELLSDAAAEITTKLRDTTVEVNLRGRDAQFVVTEAAAPAQQAPPTAPTGEAAVDAESGDLVRITLRLPEGLKDAVERLAAAEAISVNAWLVRAIGQLVSGGQFGPRFPGPPSGFPEPPGRGRMGRRLTGFAQA